MLKYKVSRRLYPLMMLWAVLQSFWLASRSASCRQWRSFCGRSSNLFGLLVDQRAVGSGGFFFYACYCFRLFFLAGLLFYVGDASFIGWLFIALLNDNGRNEVSHNQRWRYKIRYRSLSLSVFSLSSCGCVIVFLFYTYTHRLSVSVLIP
jgi:hypothetical protein